MKGQEICVAPYTGDIVLYHMYKLQHSGTATTCTYLTHTMMQALVHMKITNNYRHLHLQLQSGRKRGCTCISNDYIYVNIHTYPTEKHLIS